MEGVEMINPCKKKPKIKLSAITKQKTDLMSHSYIFTLLINEIKNGLFLID